MARVCTVCAHPKREQIDHDLVGGMSLRTVAETHTTKAHPLTAQSLSRHRQAHVSPALAALVQAEHAEEHAGSLLEQLRGLLGRVHGILEAAEASGSLQTALGAVREARGVIELTARMTGELDERPQTLVLNLATSEEWTTLRGTILAALSGFPDAKRAVMAALAGAGEARVIEP